MKLPAPLRDLLTALLMVGLSFACAAALEQRSQPEPAQLAAPACAKPCPTPPVPVV